MKGHFALLEKSAEGILCGGNSDLQQFSNDESFPLVAMASFFVSSFWFLRGSRARIISMEKMIETL